MRPGEAAIQYQPIFAPAPTPPSLSLSRAPHLSPFIPSTSTTDSTTGIHNIGTTFLTSTRQSGCRKWSHNFSCRTPGLGASFPQVSLAIPGTPIMETWSWCQTFQGLKILIINGRPASFQIWSSRVLSTRFCILTSESAPERNKHSPKMRGLLKIGWPRWNKK